MNEHAVPSIHRIRFSDSLLVHICTYLHSENSRHGYIYSEETTLSIIRKAIYSAAT